MVSTSQRRGWVGVFSAGESESLNHGPYPFELFKHPGFEGL